MCHLLKITGKSLAPDYEDGDFVLVTKIPIFFRALQPGDAVAFRYPQSQIRIKIVEKVAPGADQVFVIGRHVYSVDSRQLGPVPRRAIIGKVIWHFHR